MSDDQQQQTNPQPKPEPKPEHQVIQPPPAAPSGPPKGFETIDWVKKSQDPEVTRKDRGSDE